MQHRKRYLLTLILTLGMATSAWAQGSVQNLSSGIGNSAQGAGQSVVGTLQVSAAVVAVPMKLVGAVGQVSDRAGDGLLNFAHGETGQPLPLTDEHVTAGPSPAQVMQPAQVF